MKILLITYYWPPKNAIATHRPYSWAKYWSETGADVTVLTSIENHVETPLDLELPLLKDVNVIKVRNQIKLTKIKKFIPKKIKNIIKWVNNSINYKNINYLDDYRDWINSAVFILKKKSSQFDIIISTHGPYATHLIAAEIKKINPAIYWVADYRDLWSQNHLYKISQKERDNNQKLELESVGLFANLITTVSVDLCMQLSELLKKEVHYVPNGFDASDDDVIERLQSSLVRLDYEQVRVVYTGNLYDGYRDPLPILDALANLYTKGKLKDRSIVIDFYGENGSYLRKIKLNPLYTKFVNVMGHVDRQTALKKQKEADILLLLESSNFSARGVLTGKIFEYIASGRPILCVGSDEDYEIGRLLKITKTGIVLKANQIESIEECLINLINYKNKPIFYNPVITEIQKYSRKKLAGELYDYISKETTRNKKVVAQ